MAKDGAMIVFTEAAAPTVRPGELHLGGRRAAARAIPYAGDAAPPGFRFDPLERRFVALRDEVAVAAGPADAEAWREAWNAAPPGPVAVGPCSPSEPVYGAYRAAAEGALAAGRGVYLIDPEAEGLPSGADGSAVAVVSFRPGPLPPALAAAAAAGLAAGLALPAIPGWTSEDEVLEPLLSEAVRAGARFVCVLHPAWDGLARRLAVDARASVDPGSAESFFERIHHAGSEEAVAVALAAVRAACARRRLPTLPPRPRGRAEAEANARAASLLEERALESEADEHRAAMLHAAVRWIDESGRDLAPVLAEGNLRKVFPFGAVLASEIEAAIFGAR
jgi:hypothetical protein